MCNTCGCSGSAEDIAITRMGEEEHGFSGGGHRHDHHHDHHHNHRVLQVEQEVLSSNNLIAEENRKYFQSENILALNLVSSPGSGKTTILERTIGMIGGDLPVAVIEGDQQTLLDAERIEATGVPVVQVNTGAGCHLDADMVHRALHKLSLQAGSILLIENVGNLVCPAMFDLGEAAKVVIISVTEGEDKPLKYPAMFDAADVCLINKTDLLPYVNFNVERCRQYAMRVNHDLTFFELSAKSGEGLEEWVEWLRQQSKT